MGDGTIGIGIRRPLRGLEIAASGLSAQRARLDVIAANIANAETTRGPDGTPYRRRLVQLEAVPFQPLLAAREAEGAGGRAAVAAEGPGGVRVAGVVEDGSEGPLVYDPGHPDANEDGYVRMPNVNVTDEMVEMMDARRLFEANATVFQAIKSMLRRAAQL